METVLTKKHTRRGEAEETGEGELQEKTGHLRETRRGHPQERRTKREETESQGSRPKEERQQAERLCLGIEPQRQALPTGLASLKLTFTSKNWPLSIRRHRRSSPVKWKHLCRLLRLSLPTLSRTPPGKVSLHFPAGVRRRLSPFRSRRSAAPRLGCPHTAWHSDGDRASRDASRRLLEQTETQKPVAGTEFFPSMHSKRGRQVVVASAPQLARQRNCAAVPVPVQRLLRTGDSFGVRTLFRRPKRLFSFRGFFSLAVCGGRTHAGGTAKTLSLGGC
ncbi:hypothetical protein TGRUB_286170, partial [Toxoplasma gondii RUB]